VKELRKRIAKSENSETDLQKTAEQIAQEAYEYAENIVDTVREPLIVLDADLRVITANRSFYRVYAENIVDTVREPLIVLDADLRVITANRSFYRVFKVKPEETEGQLLYNLGNGQWDIPRLRELLEKILPRNTTMEDFMMEHNFETIERKTMLLNARQVYRKVDKTRLILLAIEDITQRRRAENALRKTSEALKRSNKELYKALTTINKELRTAELVQKSFLPQNLSDISGTEMAAIYLPCGSIGGDLYDVVEIDEDRSALLILDVAGHGAPAALISAMAKISFRRHIKKNTTPKTVCRQVNDELLNYGLPGKFLTAFLGILDTFKKEFVFSRAGHLPAILVRSVSRTIEPLTTRGSFIGVSSDAEPEEKTVCLNKGDKIIMYTDGLTEGSNSERIRFGIRRLEDVLARTIDNSPCETINAIVNEYKSFAGNFSALDDIAILAVQIV
jgi:PAS domain S-box-containing protein